MKTSLYHNAARQGFTLIECLVYISVMTVILAIGLMAFYRCWDDNKAISRNGNDIVQTLKAGEAWRAEMRAATGPITVTATNSEQTLRIPRGHRATVYVFGNGQVRKQTGADGPWEVVLQKVKSSDMEIDKRDSVTAWRWEVELGSYRKNARIRPLFTFQAMPGNSSTQ